MEDETLRSRTLASNVPSWLQQRFPALRSRNVPGIFLEPFFDEEKDFCPSHAQLSVLLVHSAAARKLLGAVSQVAPLREVS